MSIIMVAGKWDERDENLIAWAETLGETLAKNGHIVVTGGGTGIPFHVNKGVSKANGINISFLNEGKSVDKNDICYKVSKINIPTEMGWDGRSVLAVKNSEALVVLGGSNGTLNEITLAYLNNIPIFILDDSSEMIKRFKLFLLEGKYIDERKNVEIRFVKTIDEIFRISFNNLCKREINKN